MTRQLSVILNSGEISSFFKAGTDPGNEVLDTDETVIYLRDQSAMFYAEEYVEGTTYPKGSVVKYGNWLSLYKVDSDAHPAPEAAGDQQAVYPDDTNMVAVPQTAAYLLFGNRYITPDLGFLAGLRVKVTAGNAYVIYHNENPSAQSTLKTLVTIIAAQSSGWQTFTFHPKLFSAGTTIDIIVSEREVNPTPTIYTANYNYQLTSTLTAPANGYINHAKSNTNILYIPKIDADAIDQYQSGYALYNLDIGSHITISTMKWAVQGITDMGTYLEVYIAPAIRLSTGGLYNCSFEDPNTTTLTYHREVNYNLGNPNVRGLFVADGNYIDIVEDDNQYGVDLLWQPAHMTDDCDILAYSGGDLLTAGSGASLQEQINALEKKVEEHEFETYTSASDLGPSLSLAEIQSVVPAEHPYRFLIKDPTNTWIVIYDGTNYYSELLVQAT